MQDFYVLIDKLWTCTFCDFKVKRKDQIREHIEHKHVNDGQFYSCIFCPKKMKTRSYLRSHIAKIHKTDRDTHDIFV